MRFVRCVREEAVELWAALLLLPLTIDVLVEKESRNVRDCDCVADVVSALYGLAQLILSLFITLKSVTTLVITQVRVQLCLQTMSSVA